MVSWEVFAKQSETFLLFSPDLNVARARTLAYFQEVEQDGTHVARAVNNGKVAGVAMFNRSP